ncbi:MAG: class I SAM-dependent methyltransferase [Armatimonadetes bacterium]|nr:class I SAM-dependent methyltransferase [Armatimonadota bacterium]
MDRDLQSLLGRLERTADDFWNISRENGQMLNFLARTLGARRVLEVGTSNAYSTLWFAEALRHTGGHVDSIEFDAGRHAHAQAHVAESGLGGLIALHHGDALQVIPVLDGPYDLVFLDADKPQYLAYARLALPKLRPGGLLIGDDTASLADQMRDYLEFVHGAPDLHTIDLSLDDGLTLSLKLG